MLNYTKTALKTELLADLAAIPENDFLRESVAKKLAISMLDEVEENGAYLHIRVNSVSELKAQQVEIHVTGRTINVSPL